MANIGVAQIVSSAPLIDRVQSVHQGQGGTANPQVAEALVRKHARAKEQVEPPPEAERVANRDDRRKRDDRGSKREDDPATDSAQADDDETSETPRKHIDITA